MQYEVSKTVSTGRTTNQRKVPKWLSFKNYQVRITKYLMCIYGGHMCICIPNMKFLCLTLCKGEVCTDDANDDGQSMIEKALWLINQMSQKEQKHLFKHLLSMVFNTVQQHVQYNLFPSTCRLRTGQLGLIIFNFIKQILQITKQITSLHELYACVC